MTGRVYPRSFHRIFKSSDVLSWIFFTIFSTKSTAFSPSGMRFQLPANSFKEVQLRIKRKIVSEKLSFLRRYLSRRLYTSTVIEIDFDAIMITRLMHRCDY